MALYKVHIDKEAVETINLPFNMDNNRRAKERSEAAARHGAPLHYVRIHKANRKVDKRKFINNPEGLNQW